MKSPEAWLTGPEAWLGGPEAWLKGPEAWLGGPAAWLEGPEAWPAHSLELHFQRGLLPKMEESRLEKYYFNSRSRKIFQKSNKKPKGIKWSAVPLPCSTFSLVLMGAGIAATPIGDKVL